MDSFKVRKHKSAFCRVQLSIPDVLKDQIDNYPPHFQDESLKWAAAQKESTLYSIFVALCIVPTSQFFISPTVNQTHLINATSVTLHLVLSYSFKFTVIEKDALGFVCNFFSFGIESLFLWRKRVVLYVWCSRYYQMLHNSGLQLPQRSRAFVAVTFNVSLQMQCFFKWKIVFCMMPTGGVIRVHITQAIFCNHNYWSFTYEWSQTFDF